MAPRNVQRGISRREIQKGAQLTFLADVTKIILPLSHSKRSKDSYMIYPPIESSDFLFWQDNIIDFDFWKFCGKQTKIFSCFEI